MSRHLPPRTGPVAGRRWPGLISASSFIAASLSIAIGAGPVLAECVPTAAAFPPGHWVAQGFTLRLEDTDQVSTLVLDGKGGFDLTIDDHGAAGGTLSLAGQGYIQDWIDEGSSEASYLRTGQLSGTSLLIQVDGQTDWQIAGEVDVEPNDDHDHVTDGQDLIHFDNSFSTPFTSQFAPTAASCNSVFGALGGPADLGTQSPTSQAWFMAVRQGPAAQPVDVQGQLADLLADAQSVLNMAELDTDALSRFLSDMLQFESLLASLEACDPGNELDMGATWALFQSVMFNTIRTFLDAAHRGAYSTQDLITTIGIWIQGGSLGWRAADCLEINDHDDAAIDLLVRFEDVLLERYRIAEDAAARDEMAIIAVAAYQYGLPRVIAAVEGR